MLPFAKAKAPGSQLEFPLFVRSQAQTSSELDVLITQLAHNQWDINRISPDELPDPSQVFFLNLSGIDETEGWVQKAQQIQRLFSKAVIVPVKVRSAIFVNPMQAGCPNQSPPPMHFPFGDVETFKSRTLSVPKEITSETVFTGDIEGKIKNRPDRVYNLAAHNTGFTLEAKLGHDVFITETRLDLATPESTLLKDLYITHAAVQIESFFSLACSCYNQFPPCIRALSDGAPLIILVNSPPGLQTGMGWMGRQAAHSAIVTGLELKLNHEFFHNRRRAVNFADILKNPSTEIKELLALYKWSIDDLKKVQKGSPVTPLQLKHFPTYTFLSSATDLRLRLASTMDLPAYVNDFDSLLERNCRENAMKLLNRCYRGEITPEEVVISFKKDVQSFLSKSLIENENKRKWILSLEENLTALTESLINQADFKVLLKYFQNIQYILNTIQGLTKVQPTCVLQKVSDKVLDSLGTVINLIKKESSELFNTSSECVKSIRKNIKVEITIEEFEDIIKEIKGSLITDMDVSPSISFDRPLNNSILSEELWTSKFVKTQLDILSDKRFCFFAQPGYVPGLDLLKKLNVDLLNLKSISSADVLAECDAQEFIAKLRLKLLEDFPEYFYQVTRLVTDMEETQAKLLFPKNIVSIEEAGEKAGVATT